MAANSKQPKRESRAQRRQEEQARVQAKRERLQKERRTQTIIGIVVTVVLIALIAIAGIAVYRNTHPSAARQQEAANEQSAAQATLKDSKVKPAKASELGGLLMSKNGYNKPVEGVPTVGIYMDFMCPGCGMDRYSWINGDSNNVDDYSSRTANAAIYVAEHDDDPNHLLNFITNLYAKDFQPEEGSGYKQVTDDQIKVRMDGTGISKDVQGKAMQRGYDKWLDAVNTYTPTRSELFNRSGQLKGSMSTPTMTINGYYWDMNSSEVTSHKTLAEAFLEAIGLAQNKVGDAEVRPSIGATGKPLIGYADDNAGAATNSQ
ncbi:MAG: disulfide bond formation protein DsbA [Bifidobacterium animalis]|nr:disulfide bond formation protein DsbA [Bifidobacterium animalis]